MDNQAPPINFNIKSIFNKIEKKLEFEEKREAGKDAHLIELGNLEQWKTFKEIVERRIEVLKSMIDSESGESLIDFNDNPFTIGLKFLIVSFTIYQLRRLIELPDIIREVSILEKEEEKNGKQK